MRYIAIPVRRCNFALYSSFVAIVRGAVHEARAAIPPLRSSCTETRFCRTVAASKLSRPETARGPCRDVDAEAAPASGSVADKPPQQRRRAVAGLECRLLLPAPPLMPAVYLQGKVDSGGREGSAEWLIEVELLKTELSDVRGSKPAAERRRHRHRRHHARRPRPRRMEARRPAGHSAGAPAGRLAGGSQRKRGITVSGLPDHSADLAPYSGSPVETPSSPTDRMRGGKGRVDSGGREGSAEWPIGT
jgi:hypothetical protein